VHARPSVTRCQHLVRFVSRQKVLWRLSVDIAQSVCQLVRMGSADAVEDIKDLHEGDVAFRMVSQERSELSQISFDRLHDDFFGERFVLITVVDAIAKRQIQKKRSPWLRSQLNSFHSSRVRW
jgi:hypothetical protein